MKKIIFALLATATSISFANADTPFNGFYLGAEGGFTQRTVTDSVVENSSGGGQSTQSGFISSSYKNKINGFVYGLMGGYGRNINGFYLGGEVTVQDDTANKIKVGNLTATDASKWPFASEYKRGLVFGVGPRVGMVFANSMLAYGKVGLELSRDKAMHQSSGGNISSPPSSAAGSYAASSAYTATKTKMVLVPGVGLEKAFNNILARVEYNYNPGAKIAQTANYSSGGFSNNDNQTIKYTAHIIKVGLAYQF
ncbi:MAG: hypothetical protein K2W94_06770 [Alphaproteobacteria bacterium]|nr:hypothetical protein [Alphaproteobacteria bacterium]